MSWLVKSLGETTSKVREYGMFITGEIEIVYIWVLSIKLLGSATFPGAFTVHSLQATGHFMFPEVYKEAMTFWYEIW